MPKMKTKKAAAKRFKITASGKMMRKQAYRQHDAWGKSKKQRRPLVKRLDWDGVCAITLILCAVLAVGSLFAVFCCWIYDSPSIAAWGWTLLGSVITGVVILLLMAIIDD